MADGPPGNLPAGLAAYAGYVNDSGIGETWPAVEAIPALYHLSITTNGSPAMCADVERGAMRDWTGYPVGYASVSLIAGLVHTFGRPEKVWTAHTGRGPHICGPHSCGTLTFTADATQCIPGAFDLSLLRDDFFSFQGPPLPPLPKGVSIVGIHQASTGRVLVDGVTTDGHKHVLLGPDPIAGSGGPKVVTQGNWTDLDLSDQLGEEEHPGTPVLFES